MKTKTQLISILILLLSYPCFVMARETANKTSSHNKSSAIKPSGNNRNPPSNNRPPVSKPESNKPPTNNQRPQAPKPEANKPPTSNSRPPISKPESSKPPTNNNRPEGSKPPTNNSRPPISKPEGNKPPTHNSRPPISKPGGNKPPTNNHRPPISKPEGNKPPLNNSKPPKPQQNNSTTINEYYDYDIENNYYGYYDNPSTATRSNKKTDKNELDPGTALLIGTSSFPTLTTMTLYKVFTEQGENSKQVALLRAQQDAMLFIASDGEHKGVYLENILSQLREQQQFKTHTELELAQAILVLE
ncbi:DUF2388 domain-containing protein [Entomomonas asaccharolytica]|uniref:DUF2388 domain-containing protein n=1 Tax=Entomomonas asaccharolytica TaxID=2785331 RepID=A0A974RWV1_9GAMM|nr:DUF2388 domain-containing protein [Entomomonas asaccharolytica]QQP85550.1 DUF2388 domain-containing protein [Entomomonas asaccharolytica]